MNLYWQNKAPYTHKVKPPKRKERDPEGYIQHLIRVQYAIDELILKVDEEDVRKNG